MLLMGHGPRASPLMNHAYYVLFRVPCFSPSLIVPCFKARVPKILGPARPTCVSCHASCLTETCSCRTVPYGHVLCPCCATCRPAHWPSLARVKLGSIKQSPSIMNCRNQSQKPINTNTHCNAKQKQTLNIQ